MTKLKWLTLATIISIIVGGYVFFAWEQTSNANVEFTRQGVNIIFDKPTEIKKVIIKDDSGQLLSVLTLGPGKRQITPIFIKWENNRKYEFELIFSNNRSVIFTKYSPVAEMEKVSLNFEAPYGLDNSSSIGLIPVNSTFIANFLLINHISYPITLNIDLEIPEGVEVVTTPTGMKYEETDSVKHIKGKYSIKTKNEHLNEQMHLKATKAGIKPKLKLTVTVDDGQSQWQLTKVAEIAVASVADIGDKIRILAVDVPVDLLGRSDPKTDSGNLIYTPPDKLTQLTGKDPISFDDEPFVYAGITIGNNADENILTLVTGKILDPSTNKLALAFKSPPHKNAGLGYSYGVVSIPPKSSKQIILPLYLNENSAIGGNYLFKVESSIFGTNQTIASVDTQIHLNTRSDRPFAITLLMVLIAIIGIGWLLWRREHLLASFSTKELVIISLFGTVTFVTVSLPQTLLWDIIRVIFGPFTFLITGFFSQTMVFALQIALVTVLPRPGTITLMIIVRFILSGFIFGNFSPTQILNCATLAIFLEVALYVAGATRSHGDRKLKKVVIIALACGVVDIITTYMNFMAYMILYRLYYAEWYIFSVITSGFIYTIIGAAAGCRLGNNLKRTALD